MEIGTPLSIGLASCCWQVPSPVTLGHCSAIKGICLGADLNWLIEKVAAGFGVETEDLKSGSRSRAIGKARAALCYLEVRELGVSCASLAKELRISPSAVSKSIGRWGKEFDREHIQGLLESP
jgi:hypothetical protein